jgi:hypothetical protein
MRLFTTARTQPRARRELAAREKATIEDGVGNAFGIEEGPPVRAGAFLHVGHNEDCARDRQGRVPASARKKTTLRAVFHLEVAKCRSQHIINGAHVIFCFDHKLIS